jgi:hypothetical protein
MRHVKSPAVRIDGFWDRFTAMLFLRGNKKPLFSRDYLNFGNDLIQEAHGFRRRCCRIVLRGDAQHACLSRRPCFRGGGRSAALTGCRNRRTMGHFLAEVPP